MGPVPLPLSVQGSRRWAPAVRRAGLAAVLLLIAFIPAAPAAAQEPQDTLPRDTLPGDTLRPDTIRVPIPPEQVVQDTLPPDSLLETEEANTVRPYPAFPAPGPEGWAAARWVWERDDLLRHHELSLYDLLEEVPGVTLVRTGAFGRSAAVSLFGWGGGRVRVFLDGFELDPLTGSTADLQELGLRELERVVVRRTPTELRVELTTFRLRDPAPIAMVEVGTGADDINLLHALFARPFGSRHVVTVGGSLASTDGIGIDEPFKATTGRLAWTYAPTDGTRLRLEYLANGAQRTGETWGVDYSRNALILRGAVEPAPGLHLDAMLGRTGRDPAEGDSLGVEASSLQGALRAGWDVGFGWLEADARVRSGQDLALQPETEFGGRAVFAPFPLVTAQASARRMSLDGESFDELSAGGSLALPGGLRAFAEVARGSRPATLAGDSTAVRIVEDVDEEGNPVTTPVPFRDVFFPTVTSEASAVRAGAEWSILGARLGAAVVRLGGGTVVPFGVLRDDTVRFEGDIGPVDVEETEGWEAYLDLPIPILGDAVHLTGWYERWSDLGGRPYLPREEGEIALRYHDVYIDGQLEPTMKLSFRRRGEMLIPALDEETGEFGFTGLSEPYDLLDFTLQIRILDLRAFVIWTNLLNAEATDFPDTPFLGPVAAYGVRWVFRN